MGNLIDFYAATGRKRPFPDLDKLIALIYEAEQAIKKTLSEHNIVGVMYRETAYVR